MEELKIIKIGGNIIDDAEKLSSFLDDFSALSGQKILVHGGGKIATRVAESLGYKAEMIDGKRITDVNMLKVVVMTYGGLINKQIVAGLQSRGCNATGLTGADGGIITSKKRPVINGVDYGFVGDIEQVDARALAKFIFSGFVPVLAPLTVDKKGQLLNTNADNIAGFIAVALSEYYKTRLIYTFELSGVMADISDPRSVISKITRSEFVRLKDEQVIAKGMIAKLEASFRAIENGVSDVIICNASELKTLHENRSCGTQLIADER